MSNNNFKPLMYHDLKLAIMELLDESSKLKKELFNNIVMKKDFDSIVVEHFVNYLNLTLNTWAGYANGTKDGIVHVKIDDCDENKEVIDFNFIKNYIYANNDYASILQFVDGLLKGIESGKFNVTTSIESFKDHTIGIAFSSSETTVAGILDSVSPDALRLVTKNSTSIDLKYFDTIKTYDDMFNTVDKIELYRSIARILEYISDDKIVSNLMKDRNSARLFISFIINIAEYINYSVATYMIRIFIINKYATPFVNCVHHDGPITESTHHDDDVLLPTDICRTNPLDGTDINMSENPNGSFSNSFYLDNELLAKDPSSFLAFVNNINRYFRKLNLPLLEVNHKYLDDNDKFVHHSRLFKGMNSTLLYRSILNICNDGTFFPYSGDQIKNNNILKSEIRDLLYQHYHGLSGKNSAKNDFLQSIKYINYGTTFDDFKKLSYDLGVLAVNMNVFHTIVVNTLKFESVGANPNATNNDKSEIMKFMIDFYEESMFVICQKISILEDCINKIKEKEMKNTIKMVSLDIPGLKTDESMDDAMMMSIPVATNASTAMAESVDVDTYMIPIYEGFELLDCYHRSLGDFADDLYLKEITDTPVQPGVPIKNQIIDAAGNTISSVINKIKSLIAAIWQKVQYFWNSQSFVAAKKWVIDNEQMLRGLQFTQDVKMDVLPYKEQITLPEGFDNLSKNLMNFNQDSISSSDNLQKYLHTLYPSDQVAQWFGNDTTGKVAAQQYMNLILFDTGSSEPKTAVNISGNDIQKYMNTWIDTIKGSDPLVNSFKTINDAINTGIGSVSSKLVDITNQNKQAAASQTPDAASTDASAAAQVDNSQQQSPDQAPTQNNNQNNNAAPANSNASLLDAGTRITSAITRLWSPVAPMIIRAIMNQYSYIKTAYGLGQSSPQQNPSTPAQPQQAGQL